MRSVLAETIDIVIEKSHGTLEKMSVDDVVIGVFFLQGSNCPQDMPALPSLLLVKCRKRCAVPRVPQECRQPEAWKKHPSWKSSHTPWTATF